MVVLKDAYLDPLGKPWKQDFSFGMPVSRSSGVLRQGYFGTTSDRDSGRRRRLACQRSASDTGGNLP